MKTYNYIPFITVCLNFQDSEELRNEESQITICHINRVWLN